MRSFKRSSGRSRRKMDWLYANFTSSGIVTAPALVHTVASAWVVPPGNAVDNLALVPMTTPVDRTLTRSRHRFGASMRSLDSSIRFDNSQLFAGVLRWNDIDDTSPTILETPWPSQGQFDWVWHQVFHVTSIVPAAGIQIYDNGDGPGDFVDSRAQRKLSSGEGLLLVVDFLNNDNAAKHFTWNYYGRFLMKLP